MLLTSYRVAFMRLPHRRQCLRHNWRAKSYAQCIAVFTIVVFATVCEPLQADDAGKPVATARAEVRKPENGTTKETFTTSNEVLRRLVQKGVYVREGLYVPLPPPTMPDGLDAATQQAVISRVAAPRRTVKQLTRRSVVAPFVLEVHKPDGIATLPDSRVRQIDLWFIAYGRVDDLANRDFLQQLAGATADASDDELPTRWHVFEAEELMARNIPLVSENGSEKELYFHSTFPLLDRVLIRATRQAMVTHTTDSILLAGRLDPRFVNDREFPNAWQPITLDDLGKPRLGESTPYIQGGFYVKATRLHEPEGALFIEYHQAYEEPKAWFRGANLLRSKLPLIVQDTVRKFRRRLSRLQSSP